MATTIKDIAKTLNISVSTVSYALNGGPRTVPTEVRDRVLATARELRYRPNRLARSLITRRSFTVGVVPTDPAIHLAITPYFQGVVNGVLNESEILGQDVLVFTRYSQMEVEKMADALMDGRADGLIFLAPALDSPIFERLRGDVVPYVVTSSAHRDAPSFGVDNRRGVQMALEHLYNLGHRRIAHIAGKSNMEDAIARRAEFLEFVALRELPRMPILDGDFTAEGGYGAAQEMFTWSPVPTAIFAANDEIATGVLRAAWEKGIRVPEQLSVVGFDNAAISRVTYPAITTVRQPLEEIGRQALRSLITIIDTGVRPPSQQFSTELIVRDSTTRPQEDNHL